MITNERFNGIRAFVQAAQAGSFSAAARQLGQQRLQVCAAPAYLAKRGAPATRRMTARLRVVIDALRETMRQA